MQRRFSPTEEFLVLLSAEVWVLMAVAYIDWLMVNNIIYASDSPRLASILPAYDEVFETIKWAIILPTLALVGLLKRNFVSIAAWFLSLYIPLATGTEDFVYFAVGNRALPNVWPWLDKAWGIGWTRALTGTAHVTTAGLAVATVVGWLTVASIFCIIKARGPLGDLRLR